MRRPRPEVGDIVRFALPTGRVIYGRVLRDSAIGFYRPSKFSGPKVGDRDYAFVVGVYDAVLTSKQVQIVGHDKNTDPNDDWPPANRIVDLITGAIRVYEHGQIREPYPQEKIPEEPAAVWNLQHILDRFESLKG